MDRKQIDFDLRDEKHNRLMREEFTEKAKQLIRHKWDDAVTINDISEPDQGSVVLQVVSVANTGHRANVVASDRDLVLNQSRIGRLACLRVTNAVMVMERFMVN